MARSGKFGRLPRTAPDISSAIIALAREFIAAEERNYVDAWNNGGEVDGVRVTDDVLLAFFRKRRDGLSKKDPDWDKYNNVLGQYEFAIENSKMELKYAEGKVTDAGMAKFYREQAGKYPVDSEIYRKLRTLAAQYTERAARASSGGSRRASSAGYDSSVNKIEARYEWGYNAFWDYVEKAAREEGILVKEENEDLLDLRVSDRDYNRLNDLIYEILESDRYDPWRTSFEATMRKFDPNFKLDLAYIANMKKQGVTARYNLAVNNGKRGDAKDAYEELSDVGILQGRMLLRDPLQQYEDARAALNHVLEDEDSDPLERWNAVQTYIGTIEGLRNQVNDAINGPAGGFEGSGTILGRLNNELTVLYGGDVVGGTLWDNSAGTSIANADAESTAESRKVLAESINNLASGSHVLMRGEDIEGFGQGWVVVPFESVVAAEAISFAPVGGTSRRRDDAGNLITSAVPSITINSPDGASKTTMLPMLQYATLGMPVVARAAQLDPVTGRPVAGVAPAESQRLDVAYRFEMPDGTVLWSYWDANGVRRWSNIAPFAEGLKAVPQLDGRSYVVDLIGAEEGWTADAVIGEDFLRNADALSLTVFQSSSIAWMMSQSPSEAVGTRAVGVANPRALEVAIVTEFGGNALAAQAALAEASNYRATYLQNTPDAQRQLMSAFQRGLVPALAPATTPAVYDKDGNLVKLGERLPVQGLREATAGLGEGEISEGALMRQYINMFRTGQTTPGVNEDGDFILRANPMDVGTIRPFHNYTVGRGLSWFGPDAVGLTGTPDDIWATAADFNKLLKDSLDVTVKPNLPEVPAGSPIVNPNTGFVTPTTPEPPPNTYPYQPQPIAPPPPGSPGPPNIPGEEFDPDFNPPVAPPPPPSGGRPPAAPIPV